VLVYSGCSGPAQVPRNPDYSDVKYIESISARTSQHVPLETIDAYRDTAIRNYASNKISRKPNWIMARLPELGSTLIR